MDLANTKVKDLGNLASEKLTEMGKDILDMADEGLEELKEKMDHKKK